MAVRPVPVVAVRELWLKPPLTPPKEGIFYSTLVVSDMNYVMEHVVNP